MCALQLHFAARSPPSRDNAALRWGFRCSARGVTAVTAPFLLDLENTVAGLAARLCQQLIRGSPSSPDEEAVKAWFDSSVLQSGVVLPAANAAAAAASTSDDVSISVVDLEETLDEHELPYSATRLDN